MLSYWTVTFMLVWNNFTMLKRLEGSQSSTILKTVLDLKCFVRSIKAIYTIRFCSLHFSCISCRLEKIVTVVVRCDLVPHCKLGYTLLSTSVGEDRLHASSTKQSNSPITMFLYKVIISGPPYLLINIWLCHVVGVVNRFCKDGTSVQWYMLSQPGAFQEAINI